MKTLGLTLGVAIVVSALAGGCSGDRSNALLADNPKASPGVGTSIGAEAGAAASAEGPVAGARIAAVTGLSGPRDKVPGPGVFNSDNRGIITRSGLNSDPANPSGMPGRPSPAGG